MPEITRAMTSRNTIDLNSPYKQMAQSSVTLFESENKIALNYASYYTGIRQGTTRRYWRWETHQVIGFRRNHKGTICPYVRNKNQNGWVNNVPSEPVYLLNTEIPTEYPDWISEETIKSNEVRRKFQKSVETNFGVSGLYDIFPQAEAYNYTQYYQMHPEVRHAMRQKDYKDFIAELFGKSRVRRDLVRSAAQNSDAVLAFARQFRDLVPIDWIVGFIREQEARNIPSQVNVGRLRNYLGYVDRRSFRYLMNNPINDRERWAVQEMLSPYSEILIQNNPPQRTPRVRSWMELHDELLVNRGANRIRWEEVPPLGEVDNGLRRAVREATVPVRDEIDLIDEAKPFVDLQENGRRWVVASSGTQLSEWGNYMSNCIGGYKRAGQAGNTILIGIYNGEKLLANLEIHVKRIDRDLSLHQMLGRFNQSLPEKDRLEIEKVLAEHNVMIPENYWGRDARLDNEW